jgi:hypothetical protein
MWFLLSCVHKQFVRRFCPIRRLFECGSLTFGENHIVVVVRAKKSSDTRHYDFAPQGSSGTFSRGEKMQNLKLMCAEWRFLARLEICSLILSFEERMLFCVVVLAL